MEKNIDNLNSFKDICSRRFPKNSTFEHKADNVKLELTDEFKEKFPQFTRLIESAEISEISVNDILHRMYVWSSKDNNRFVWICDTALKTDIVRKPTQDEENLVSSDILPEHLLLVRNVGGIIETWDLPDDESFMTWAKNFVFSLQYSYKLQNTDFIYSEDGWIFDEVEESKKLPVKDLICFSEEANGNLTIYNKYTGEIFLLLGDHCFEYVDVVDGHPEYSFYTIRGISHFTEYAELLASQMLNEII